MNDFELSLIKVHERTVLVFHTWSIPVGPLQVGVEVLAGFQGSSQHCCIWWALVSSSDQLRSTASG